jgi:hypothetical protein
MSDGKPLDSERCVTLESGKEIKIKPLAWWALGPLLKSVWHSSAAMINELAKNNVDTRTLAGALLGMLGEPEKWTVLAAPETVCWLVGGSVEGVERGEDGVPSLDDWSADDVTEALPHVLKVTDMSRLGARLKNSLLPAVGVLSAAVAGETKEPTEPPTSGKNESSSESADTTASTD